MREFQDILNEIYQEISPHLSKGKVASYIPALAKVDPDRFAMSVTMFDGRNFHVGCHEEKFSIQSISKVFTFTKALNLYGKEIYKRVGREPSGNPFNSLVQLEYEKGIPRNPFINAGAIVVTDSLLSNYQSVEKTFDTVLSFVNEISDKKSINFNRDVWNSEYQYGFRNMALANLMKSFNNIENSVENVVRTYFKHCSIEMSTKDLSRAMLYLANHGIDPINNKRFITPQQAKRVNALMLTCGHYDASGDFAFYVGLPGKSGVGGGIVAIVPRLMSIAVFSPRLNSWGNSFSGTKALELFAKKTDLSIF